MKLNNAYVLGVDTKAGTGKFIGRNFYTVTVRSEIGDQIKLDWGSKSPPSLGTNITVECADVLTYGKYKVLTGGTTGLMGAPVGGVTNAMAGNAKSGVGFPLPSDSHQISIVRQNALGHAVTLATNFPEQMLGADWQTKSADHIVRKVIEAAFTLSEFSSGKLELDVTQSLADKLRS